MKRLVKDLLALAAELGYGEPVLQGDGHVRVEHPVTGEHVTMSGTAYDGAVRRRYERKLYRAAGAEQPRVRHRYNRNGGHSSGFDLDAAARAAREPHPVRLNVEQMQRQLVDIDAELDELARDGSRRAVAQAQTLVRQRVAIAERLEALHKPCPDYECRGGSDDD